MNGPIITVVLDLNVFVADLLSKRVGSPLTADRAMVDYVRSGRCPAGPVQLIISVPMIENLENVLRRKLGLTDLDARRRTRAIQRYSELGPVALPPSIVVGSGHLPIETERQTFQSEENFRTRSDGSLFDAVRDDRYVLEAAVAGRADLLVTNNLRDFRRGSVVDVGHDEAFIYATATHRVVVCSPRWAHGRLLPGMDLDKELSTVIPLDEQEADAREPGVRI